MSKRDKILETTLDLISEVGFHATSINLIIKKSNVSVLPTETANLKTFFEGVSQISDHTKDPSTQTSK